MHDDQAPRLRRSFRIGRLSASHLLVVAYAALLLGFVIVAIAMGVETQR